MKRYSLTHLWLCVSMLLDSVHLSTKQEKSFRISCSDASAFKRQTRCTLCSFVQPYFGHEQKGRGLTKRIAVSVNESPHSDVNLHHYTNYPGFSRLLQSSWCATDFMKVGMQKRWEGSSRSVPSPQAPLLPGCELFWSLLPGASLCGHNCS